jgi:hypothetical protein
MPARQGSADEGDPSPTEREQVGDGQVPALDVVDRDG